jgi:hypothetical protein
MKSEGIMSLERFIGFLALASVLGGCGAQGMQVYRLDSKTQPPSGKRYLVYALPQTVLSVDLPVTRTITKPGRCTAFLNARLEAQTAGSSAATFRDNLDALGVNLENIPSQDLSRSKLGDVSIAQYWKPDPKQLFAISLHQDLFDSNKLTIELNEQGILGAASLESSNKVVETTVKTLSAAATIAAAALPLFGGAALDPSKKTNDEVPPYCFRALAELRSLRASRGTIVSGSANGTISMSKEALEFLLSELKVLDDAYVAQFTGHKAVSSTTIHCDITPQTIDAGDAVTESVALFKLGNDGISSLNASCVVAPEFLAPGAGGGTEEVILQLHGDATFARAAAKREPKQAKDYVSGLYYRIPVRAAVRVMLGQKEQKRAAFDIPQYGSLVSLPGDADVEGASLALSAKFGPAGGLISLGQTNTAPDTASLVEGAGGAAKTVFDAEKARRDAEADAELKALEREKKRLELLRDIGALSGHDP